MKNHLIIFWICYLVAGASTSHAEEALKRFSIGYDKLNLPTIYDTKAPVTNTVTAIYHFNNGNDLTPYIGTGLGYTLHPEIKPGDRLKINSGLAGQAGLKYQLNKNTTVDFDYKYFNLPSESIRRNGNERPESVEFGLKIKF
jgi:outer membrane protein W